MIKHTILHHINRYCFTSSDPHHDTSFLTFVLTLFPAYLLTFYLAYVSHSFWHHFGHSFWHTIWHIFCISSEILSGALSGISSDSRLRTGGEHCHPELAVEVRGAGCRPELAVEVRRGALPSGDWRSSIGGGEGGRGGGGGARQPT